MPMCVVRSGINTDQIVGYYNTTNKMAAWLTTSLAAPQRSHTKQSIQIFNNQLTHYYLSDTHHCMPTLKDNP